MSRLSLDELKEIMSACSGADEAADITQEVADTEFPELGYDSLAVLEVVSQIQRRYGIVISDEDVESISTPATLLHYVNTSLAEV